MVESPCNVFLLHISTAPSKGSMFLLSKIASGTRGTVIAPNPLPPLPSLRNEELGGKCRVKVKVKSPTLYV